MTSTLDVPRGSLGDPSVLTPTISVTALTPDDIGSEISFLHKGFLMVGTLMSLSANRYSSSGSTSMSLKIVREPGWSWNESIPLETMVTVTPPAPSGEKSDD